MISEEKLFGNLFDDDKIINRRLYTFGLDLFNRLTAANGGGDYTALIALLTTPLTALGTELGAVDTSLNLQKGKTMTVDQVMAAFKLTMSLKKGVIADALGGATTEEYLQFYPHGQIEYTQALKSQMPTLVLRINTAATANSVALGAPLTALLQGFEAQWTGARDLQMQLFGTVDDNRTDRTQARIDTELAALTVVHTIASLFPGDVEECKAFFNFPLLFNTVHHHHVSVAGTMLPNEIKVVANRLFTDNHHIRASNPDDNADYIIYLGHTATSEPGTVGKVAKFGHGIRPKPSQLGNLDDSFLLVKNMSDVNDGTYLVDYTE
jgi:hypothetical protein